MDKKQKKALLNSLNSLNRYGGEENLPKDLGLFSEFCPEFPITVFRGLTFDSFEEYQEKTHGEIPPKNGIKIRGFFGVHWTTSLEIAEEFASTPGKNIKMIISAVVDPDQVALEMDRLPSEVLKHLEWTNEEEVLLRPKPVDAKIYEVWFSNDFESKLKKVSSKKRID